MRKRAILVEKDRRTISVVLDTGGLPSGCCGSVPLQEAGAPPPGAEEGKASLCSSCPAGSSCSKGRLFPRDGKGADFFTFGVEDPSAWKLGQEVWLEFPAGVALLSALVSIVLPLAVAIGLFFLLSLLLPFLPRGIDWLLSLLAFIGSCALVTARLSPRLSSRGVRLSEKQGPEAAGGGGPPPEGSAD